MRYHVWLCAAALCGAALADGGENLLVNGGFETALEPAWEKRTPDDAKRALYLAAGAGRSGAAVVLENYAPAFTRLRQGHDKSIYVEPASLIELSAWVRAEMPAAGRATLQIYFIDTNGGTLSQPTSSALSGTFGWTEMRVRALVPSNTTYIMAYLQVTNDIGKVWFDDASLVVKVPPPEPLPPAPRIVLLTDLPDDHAVIQRARVLFEDGLKRVDLNAPDAFDGAVGALALYDGEIPSGLWSAVETFAQDGGRVFMDIRAFARCHNTSAVEVVVGVAEGGTLAQRTAAGLTVTQKADATAGFEIGQIMPRARWPDGKLYVLPLGFTLPQMATLAVAPGGAAGMVSVGVGTGQITACDLLSLREPYYNSIDAIYAFTPVSAALGNPPMMGQYYSDYWSYEGVTNEMRRLSDKYPAIRIEDEGEASGGYRLWSLNLGTPGKPLYFLYAAAHGCEWEPGYGLMTFARLIAEGKLDDVIDLKNLQIKIIPLLNPSGYTHRRRQNHNGVDLNRNGQYGWDDCNGKDTNGDGVYGPFDYDWKGTAPHGEPESAVYKRIAEIPELHCVLDFHGNGAASANRYSMISILSHPDNEIFAADMHRLVNARLRGRHLLRQSSEATVSQYQLDRLSVGGRTPYLVNTSTVNKFGMLIELPAQYANTYGTLMQTDITCEICRAVFSVYQPPEPTDPPEPVAPPVQFGSVMELRAAVRANTNLIHHYTFEGPHQGPSVVATLTNHNDYLLDRKGGLHLAAWRSSSPTAVFYGPGADPLSRSGTGVDVTNTLNNGAAWSTTNTVALPAALTVECVLRPNALPAEGSGSGYIVGTRNASDTDRRGYFLYMNPAGYFAMNVGKLEHAATFYGPVETSHWYYVAMTFAVSGEQTTVNAYVADLSAGGTLERRLTDHVSASRYTSLASRLGIGVLYNSTLHQYPSPASIDEVALYDTVLSAAIVAEHLKALRREAPTVWYREIFPNDAYVSNRTLPTEGWSCHRDLTAIHTTGPLVDRYLSPFEENVTPVSSFPSGAGVTNSYLNNFGGPTATNYIYWTGEMTNKVEFAWLRAVEFDARFNNAQPAHVAVRLDVGGTPEVTSDDVWYMSQDFTNAVGTSALAIPAGGSGPWWRYMLDMHTAEWAALDFVPGEKLELVETQAFPPERALITGFGLFHPAHVSTQNERLDNYTLYVRKIHPPPETVISVQ